MQFVSFSLFPALFSMSNPCFTWKRRKTDRIALPRKCFEQMKQNPFPSSPAVGVASIPLKKKSSYSDSETEKNQRVRKRKERNVLISSAQKVKLFRIKMLLCYLDWGVFSSAWLSPVRCVLFFTIVSMRAHIKHKWSEGYGLMGRGNPISRSMSVSSSAVKWDE